MKSFKTICEILSWEFDEKARVVFIPTWWRYNPPENCNVLKSCLSDLHELPVTKLKEKFVENIRYLPITLHETFRQTFHKGLPKPSPQPSPNQEQEQKQEQEKEQEQDTSLFSKNYSGDSEKRNASFNKSSDLNQQTPIVTEEETRKRLAKISQKFTWPK